MRGFGQLRRGFAGALASRGAGLTGVLLSMGALLGCDAATREEGELGDGDFRYLCVGTSDAQCDIGEEGAEKAFQGIALDARIGVQYVPDFPGALRDFTVFGHDRVDNLRDDALGVTVITPRVPGFTALFALYAPIAGGSSPGIEDILHVVVREPKGLQISQREPSGSFNGSFGGLSVSVGLSAPLTLRVAPIDADGNILAGALDCEWVSADPDIAEIVSDPTDNVIDVQPKRSGAATFTVTLGAQTASVDVAVGGA